MHMPHFTLPFRHAWGLGIGTVRDRRRGPSRGWQASIWGPLGLRYRPKLTPNSLVQPAPHGQMCLPHADARRLAKIIVGTIRLAHRNPPDSTGVLGVRDRGTSIWGISRALDGLNTVSQLLLLGTMATKGVPTGD